MAPPKAVIPTKANLERKPQAIVIQQFLSGALADQVAALEFEWFESDAGRIAYWDELTTWAPADVTANGDVLYAWAEVLDTATMKIGRVTAAGKSKEWEAAAVKAIKANPLVALIAPEESAKKADDKGASTGKNTSKGKVKPRKASAAAAVVKGNIAESDETPQPKARVARKKNAVASTEDKSAPAATGSKARQEALKKRLAEKKAEGGASPEASTSEGKGASVVGPKTD